MKKLLLLALLASSFQLTFAQTTKLTVFVKFTGIEDGFDHLTRTSVWIDGREIGVSPETLESKTGSFTVDVPKGNHEITVINYAQYEGKWEEHTLANEYSVDCIYESTRSFKKPERLYLVFDLNEGTRSSWKKPVKE